MNPHQKNKVDVKVSTLPTPSISNHQPKAVREEESTSEMPSSSRLRSFHKAARSTLSSRSYTNLLASQSLSPEEQRLFRLYGKLPSRSDHFAKHLKDRKYFDSGDYAMSKAGKGDGVDAGAVGSEHPVPENIPHLSSPMNNSSNNNNNGAVPRGSVSSVPGLQAGSPVKESSFLHRETTAEDSGSEAAAGPSKDSESSSRSTNNEPLAAGTGIPIRR